MLSVLASGTLVSDPKQRAKLTSGEKDGEQHHSLSVVADQVMSVYQADKRRKRANPEEVPA